MTAKHFTRCIRNTLRNREVDPDIYRALLTTSQRYVKIRSEDILWDYKERVHVRSRNSAAELAKDIASFHNRLGGTLVIGVTDDFRCVGVPENTICDIKTVKDAIRRYVGRNVSLFHDTFRLNNGHFLWLIFVERFHVQPLPMQNNSPEDKRGNLKFRKNEFFYRDGDECRRCTSDEQIEELFNGFPTNRIDVYNFDLDEQYFRLLAPNYRRFFGREQEISEVCDVLGSRHPIIALDGIGGVGKTSIAIEVLQRLYEEGNHYFIVSASAKTTVWAGKTAPRAPRFSGFRGLLEEIADVFKIEKITNNTEQLRDSVVDHMRDYEGILFIDNLETIEDQEVLNFIRDDVPAPVKVLITSRIDKRLGARTIPILEMNEKDARELFEFEARSNGLALENHEGDLVSKIVERAGCVPLAIKWAAMVSCESGLRYAAEHLKSSSLGKREFLNFCFATMFDALPIQTQNVALLLPFLDSEWNPASVSIAIDCDLSDAREAMEDISFSGITFRKKDGSYGALPLTRDFLNERWQNNLQLQKSVNRLFDEILASNNSSDILSSWPLDRRVTHLRERIARLLQLESHGRALKLIKLGQSWSTDLVFRFLEGRALLDFGDSVKGIHHIRYVSEKEGFLEHIDGDDIIYIGRSLLEYGSAGDISGSLDLIWRGLEKGGTLDTILATKFLDLSIERKKFGRVAATLKHLTSADCISVALAKIERPIRDGLFAKNNHVKIHDWLVLARRYGVLEEDDTVLARELGKLLEG